MHTAHHDVWKWRIISLDEFLRVDLVQGRLNSGINDKIPPGEPPLNIFTIHILVGCLESFRSISSSKNTHARLGISNNDDETCVENNAMTNELSAKNKSNHFQNPYFDTKFECVSMWQSKKKFKMFEQSKKSILFEAVCSSCFYRTVFILDFYLLNLMEWNFTGALFFFNLRQHVYVSLSRVCKYAVTHCQ